jgi:hypothetical protein
MYTLEVECLELGDAGIVDARTVSRALAVERGEIFSVFGELRFALYASVVGVSSGVGLLLRAHLDRIGPLGLVIGVGVAAALCYAIAIRTRLRGELRSIGGDYLLLLGALLLSADLGYAELQFHWLGVQWSWHLLMLAALHALTAYLLGSRLVLSASLASLAAWFGIDAHFNGLLQQGDAVRQAGADALVCAGAIIAWRAVHRRLGGAAGFVAVFEHVAANLAFWGALALTFASGTRLAGTALLLVIAAVAIRKGLGNRDEAFVVYGVGYTAVGLCYLETHLVRDYLGAAVLALATVTAAVVLLWRLRAHLRAAP